MKAQERIGPDLLLTLGHCKAGNMPEVYMIQKKSWKDYHRVNEGTGENWDTTVLHILL